MLTNNPFTDLPAFITPGFMKFYVILMIALVIAGTLLDIRHKQSAKYFFENSKKAQKNARRKVGGSKKAGLAVKTVAGEVLTSSEFCNSKRRMSHLLTMYGFILFVLSSAVMIFSYTGDSDTPALWPLLWHLGAIMLCVGGYWFWFAIRVDLAAEGAPWNQINGRGDIFILGLLAMATFGLLWSFFQSFAGGGIAMFFFLIFIVATTVLFATVYWSKFAHMFFKPAAAFQKKVAMADGSRENLPEDYDLSDPEVQAKFPDIPEYLGSTPPNMGLGIKREPPQHY